MTEKQLVLSVETTPCSRHMLKTLIGRSHLIGPEAGATLIEFQVQNLDREVLEDGKSSSETEVYIRLPATFAFRPWFV